MIITSFLRLAALAAVAATPLEAGWQHNPEQRLEISSPADCRKWFESQEDDEGANAEVTIQSHGVVATDNSHEPLSGCRRKVVKSRGGKKVEMSPCLVPSSNVRGRQRRQRQSSTSTSSTGTNTNLLSSASTTYHQHQHHHNNNIDSELDDYRQLQELLRQKNIPLTVPVLVVVDCKMDEKARKEEESHDDRQRRRTHARLPPEKGFTTTLYALAVLVIAFVVSRLKVKIEFKLDLGGQHAVEADAAPAVPLVVAADASAPPVVMVDAVAINNYEPQAVAVQG